MPPRASRGQAAPEALPQRGLAGPGSAEPDLTEPGRGRLSRAGPCRVRCAVITSPGRVHPGPADPTAHPAELHAVHGWTVRPAPGQQTPQPAEQPVPRGVLHPWHPARTRRRQPGERAEHGGTAGSPAGLVACREPGCAGSRAPRAETARLRRESGEFLCSRCRADRSPPRCPERTPSKAVLSLTHLQPHRGEGSRRPLSAERPQRSPERPARPCERTGQEKERGGSSRRSGTAGRFARAHSAAAAEAPPAGSALCSSSGASFFPVLFRKRGTGTGCISCLSLNIKTKHLKTKRFALQINRELEPSHGEVGLRLSWFGFISVMVLCVGVLIVFCFSLKALYKPNVTPHRIVLGVTGRDNNYPVQRSYPHMARSNKYLV